jgi:hypothetical protein
MRTSPAPAGLFLGNKNLHHPELTLFAAPICWETQDEFAGESADEPNAQAQAALSLDASSTDRRFETTEFLSLPVWSPLNDN